MPTHYGNGKGKQKAKGKSTMKPMTAEQHKKFNKAVKDGLLTQKQHDNLPAPLLEAIVKKKKGMKKSKK